MKSPPSVIGPEGKDVYPVAFLYKLSGTNNVELVAAMVEALSRDEAVGIARRLALNVLHANDVLVSLVGVRVGETRVTGEEPYTTHMAG